MNVLGTAGTAEGEKAVKQAGASQVFNHRQDGYVQSILVLSKLCFDLHLLNTASHPAHGSLKSCFPALLFLVLR